jgi:uncharacterized protein YbjT (DUF2867 family)
MNPNKTILVSGATGRQGSAVVRHLLKDGWTVKALSRTPESALSKRIRGLGVEMVRGDMADMASLERAMEGCHGAYSVQNYFEYGLEKEILYGKNMADAAKRAGVSHFIYNSVGGAERDSGVGHFESKYAIENHIRGIGLPYTILRPVAFMENYYIMQVYTGLLKGKLFDPIRGDRKFQTIAVDDIGAYAAYAFAHPEKLMGVELEIAGDELTNVERAAVLSKVMGKKVKYGKMPMLLVRIFMGKDFHQMFTWFNTAGFRADIAGNAGKYPGVRPMDFETWLLKEGWDRWDKKGKF